MNTKILKPITIGDTAYLRFKRSKNESDYAEVKKHRNKAQNSVNKSKTIF